MVEEISKSFDISSSIIFRNFRENCCGSEYFQCRHKNTSGNSEIFQRIFQNYSENLSHIFVANLTHFLPE